MISIIMPAYNEEKNIKQAIESVLRQSIKKFQLIVINDGSTDKTAEVVQQIRDERMLFINPEKKNGKNGSFNIASEHVCGDWVYFMGADDTLPTDALEKWEKYTEKYNPNELVAFSGKMKVVSESKKYNNLILPKKKNRTNFSGPNTLMSKAMHKFILPLPEDFPNEDGWWGLCIDCFAKTRVFVDEIIVNYSVHEGNSISRKSPFYVFSEKYHSRFIIRERFLEKHGDDINEKDKKRILAELKCESLRIKGKSIKILFVKNVSLIMRVRLFFFSKKFLYNFKIKFDRLFLGH